MSEYITTYTGIHFKPTEPEPGLIRVEETLRMRSR